ncbi:MAG: serine hydrolase domain-containing protein [Polymorphobacter sp.]
MTRWPFAALLALAAAAPAQTPETAALLARMKAIPMATAVESPKAYTPAETVRGKPGKALPTGSGVAAAALTAAQAYADAQGSFALIVAKDGRIVHEHYAPGFTAQSQFSTASMHKAVLALAYGAVIKAGRIALSDPLAKHLPELKDDPKGTVTIEQLLRMTSGVGSPPATPGDPAAPSTQLMFGTDNRAAARLFVLATPPGSEFAYQNASTQLAGLALQAIIKGRYADYLSKTIWAPIGASDAQLWLDRPGGNPHFFCCLQASAGDWLRIGELVRNRGKVGSKQVIAADWVATVTAASPLNPNFGMNFWRGTPHAPVRRYAKAVAMTVAAAKPFARDDVVFIDGAGGQRVYVIPSTGLTIVRIGKPSLNWDDSELVNRVLAGV